MIPAPEGSTIVVLLNALRLLGYRLKRHRIDRSYEGALRV